MGDSGSRSPILGCRNAAEVARLVSREGAVRSDANTEQHGYRARGLPGWILDAAKLIPAFGIPLYAFLYAVTASAFYGRLGVDAQAVGLNYVTVLSRSAGQLFPLAALIALAVYMRSKPRD